MRDGADSMGPVTNEDWRLAEALALERLHGANTPRFIAERIGALAIAGDAAGVERLCAIAAELDNLLSARRGGAH